MSVITRHGDAFAALAVAHTSGRTVWYRPCPNGVAKITKSPPPGSAGSSDALCLAQIAACVFSYSWLKMFSFLLFFSSVNRVSSAITFVRRKCRGGAPQKRNLCLKQFPRTTFALCLGNFIRVSGSVSGSYPMGLFMQRGIFNPEYIKGMTTNLQSKTKGQHL